MDQHRQHQSAVAALDDFHKAGGSIIRLAIDTSADEDYQIQ